MAAWSRRRVLALAALAGTGAGGGCTELFVGGPRPKLVEMEQRLSEQSQRTVEVTVTVENRGTAGDVVVTIRALDDEGDPVESVDEVHNIAREQALDLTIPIEAPTATARFVALVEPD